MNLVGVIILFLKVEDIKVIVWLGVIEGLAISAILAFSFINRLIQEIFPAGRRIVPINSIEIVIFATSTYESTI